MQAEGIIKKVIGEYIDPDEAFVFLFGSRASGREKAASDYDIGIYMGRKISLKTIALMKDRIEDYPLPVDVDIVDFFNAPKDFLKLASKGIKIWNRPKKNSKLTLPF